MANPLELPTLTRFGITLRPWHVGDADALREACGDQQIMRFTTVPAEYSEEAAIDWISRQRRHADDGTALVLAVIGPDEPTPVGMVGLFGLQSHDRTAQTWLLVTRSCTRSRAGDRGGTSAGGMGV